MILYADCYILESDLSFGLCYSLSNHLLAFLACLACLVCLARLPGVSHPGCPKWLELAISRESGSELSLHSVVGNPTPLCEYPGGTGRPLCKTLGARLPQARRTWTANLPSGLPFCRPLGKYPNTSNRQFCRTRRANRTYQVAYHSVRHLVSSQTPPTGSFAGRCLPASLPGCLLACLPASSKTFGEPSELCFLMLLLAASKLGAAKQGFSYDDQQTLNII